PGTFVYSPPAGSLLNAGDQTLSVTFTPENSFDYFTATSTVTLHINKATPTVAWTTPAAITYGTVLGASQLDATASVPGTFVYTPGAGAVPGAGSDTLSVTFTPSDSVNYNTVGATTTLQVTKATPVVSWATPAPIVQGTPLSSAQLDATASTPGTFL